MSQISGVLVMIVYACLSSPIPVYSNDSVSGFAEVNGTQLFYEMKGQGEAIVFIRSGGFDRRIWERPFSTFADHYQVIRYDVRGYGKSKPPTRPYSDEEDLHQLLTYPKISKAHLVGMSLGGRIAIDFALARPDMAVSLVPVGSGLSGYPFSAQDLMEILKVVYAIQNDDGSHAGEAWLKSIYNAPAMENPEVATVLRPIAIDNARSWLINPFFPQPPFPPAIERLKDIHVPTLLIIGDRDVLTVKTIMQTLGAGIPGAKTVVIAGAGHVANLEKSEEFNRAVREFLNGRVGVSQ